MKDISYLISQNKSLHDSKLIKTFKSKKNIVCLLEKNDYLFILKWFSQGINKYFSQENYVLSQNNTPILKPYLIDKNEEYHFFILQYIKGENICDLINNPNIEMKEKIVIIRLLATWFYQFHTYFQKFDKVLIHGDAHLRNFIFTKDQTVYGVDYEETCNGKPITDISNLCASILTTTPEFTKEKNKLVQQFLETYENLRGYSLQEIDANIQESIKKMKKRRKKNTTN